MKNWYKKPITKGILILLEHIFAVSAVISIVLFVKIISYYPQDDILSIGNTRYEDSKVFQNQLYRTATDVMETIKLKNNFETAGVYDPDKLVDNIQYGKDGTISGKNESGIAYRLEDLLAWGQDYFNNQLYEENNVVVCKKPDGTFYYYYTKDFIADVNAGKLVLEMNSENVEKFLQGLAEEKFPTGAYENISIQNAEGEELYTDCWNFSHSMLEGPYAPQGAESILDVVNHTPELNGKLSMVKDYIFTALSTIYEQHSNYEFYVDSLKEGNTNFNFVFADNGEGILDTNISQLHYIDDISKYIGQIKENKNTRYVIVKPKLSDFESNIDLVAGEWRQLIQSYITTGDGDYVFAASVDTTFPIRDQFYLDAKEYNRIVPHVSAVLAGGTVSLILFFAVLLWITLVAGRNGQGDEIHLNAFDRWKSEIAAVLVVFAWLSIVVTTGGHFMRITGDTSYVPNTDIIKDFPNQMGMLFIVFWTVVTVSCFLTGYLSLVRRIKAGTLWKNSVLRVICRDAGRIWAGRQVAFKSILLFLGFAGIPAVFLLLSNRSGWLLFVLPIDAAALYFVVRDAVMKQKIKEGIKEISLGNVDYKISTKELSGTEKELAVMINDIGNGLQRAVSEGMKSERLKTDLITNVSHDIKTPLTSIINYIDLLKREKIDDPKIQGYLDVLESKSQRLKTLTEDVLEASKVSSGNITLEYMDVNLVELVNQTVGEFSEKFEAAELQLITTMPDTPAVIHVDGRRMWRVLENVFNNAAKYAMRGTRVYLDLIIREDTVSLSLKNISNQPLNISADELTERFIRGDISRGTEGTGLGLSIAKSLVEMQGGTFLLYLDGDLFKVTIEFPQKQRG